MPLPPSPERGRQGGRRKGRKGAHGKRAGWWWRKDRSRGFGGRVCVLSGVASWEGRRTSFLLSCLCCLLVTAREETGECV